VVIGEQTKVCQTQANYGIGINLKQQRPALLKRGLLVEYASLGWMTVEALVALYSGLLAWSFALVAFGGDSLVELLSSFVVVVHMRAMLKSDSQPHILRERAEWATALLLFSLLPIIELGAGYSLLTGITPEPSLLGIGVALGAVLIMPILWYEKRRIGPKPNVYP
jgi:divalent metal cation (Fe/Co/Zn/Cd) transporter